MNQIIELENLQRLKDGTLRIPKSEVLIFGQMSLMVNESVATILDLIQTADMDAQLRMDALASAQLPLDLPDACPEDALNRILWRAMKGTTDPYPQWAVRLVEDDD